MNGANLLTLQPRIAKLSLDHSVRPYIRHNHDIAAGDAMRIINTSQSNRHMEDWSKVVSSQSSVTEKVGASLILLSPCNNEEVYYCF